jgi:hypothetical protein
MRRRLLANYNHLLAERHAMNPTGCPYERVKDEIFPVQTLGP